MYLLFDAAINPSFFAFQKSMKFSFIFFMVGWDKKNTTSFFLGRDLLLVRRRNIQGQYNFPSILADT